MKKIKLLPSIIMLALCLAVLGIGVYSATTGSNTISGTLTVNSAGHEVEITVYKGTDSSHGSLIATNMYGTTIGATTTSRAGANISLSDIAFNSDEANSIADVDMIDIIIAVKNKSSEDIGVYFWNGTSITNNQAAVSNILFGHQDLDGDDGEHDEIADAEYSFYHHISAKSGETFYTEYMHVYLRLNELVNEDVDITLDINLNVESYVANFDSSDVATAYSYSESPFVKIQKGVSGVAFASSSQEVANSTITHVVFPYGTTSLAGTAFVYNGLEYYGCSNLIAVSLPSTLTALGNGVFQGLHLASIMLPHSIGSVGSSAFNSCERLTSIVFW